MTAPAAAIGDRPSAAPRIRVARARRSRRATPIVALAIVAVLAVLPAFVDAGLTAKLVDAFVLLTMASMWNLLAGYAGLVSVGQQTFIGLGSYTEIGRAHV